MASAAGNAPAADAATSIDRPRFSSKELAIFQGSLLLIMLLWFPSQVLLAWPLVKSWELLFAHETVVGRVVGTNFDTIMSRSGSVAVRVEYNYVVKGRTYRVADARSFPGRAEAEDYVNRRPQGTRIKVHYLPRDPSRSSIRPQKWGGLLFTTVMYTGMSVCLIVAWVRLRRADRRAREYERQSRCVA